MNTLVFPKLSPVVDDSMSPVIGPHEREGTPLWPINVTSPGGAVARWPDIQDVARGAVRQKRSTPERIRREHVTWNGRLRLPTDWGRWFATHSNAEVHVTPRSGRLAPGADAGEINAQLLADYRRFGAQEMMITCAPDACSACRKFDQRRFAVRDAPGIPVAGCGRASCRCEYAVATLGPPNTIR